MDFCSGQGIFAARSTAGLPLGIDVPTLDRRRSNNMQHASLAGSIHVVTISLREPDGTVQVAANLGRHRRTDRSKRNPSAYIVQQQLRSSVARIVNSVTVVCVCLTPLQRLQPRPA
jgi:hypothetical protein